MRGPMSARTRWMCGGLVVGLLLGWGVNRPVSAQDTTTLLSRFLVNLNAGVIELSAVVFANLGTPSNGTLKYCSDCTVASPCASGGTGALAKRLNSTWVCN